MNVQSEAKGRWPAILPALGIDKKFLSNRHGPCPLCGGNDRFRFDDKEGRGTWYCNQCGAGDGFDLVMKVNRLEFKDAAREVQKHVGGAPVTTIRQGRPEEAVMAEMRAIYKVSLPIGEVQPVERWWMRRAGVLPDCADLRGVQHLKAPNREVYPAMVALVRDAQGKVVNMHRTFMDDRGEKADFASPRRVMDLPMPKGCAIRLAEPTEGILGIAEGLETAWAARLLFNVPCWASINAWNLENWIPPAGMRVIVFGDHDDSFTGQSAAYVLARRLKRERFEVSVEIPREMGWDWADVLDAKRKEAVAA